MPTKKQLQASQLYADLMGEIKIRIAAIDAGTTASLPHPPAIVREHCFLQIRFICELVALGCLVAHGDIKATQTGRLRKQWAADKIMDELTALHPDFYPVPIKRERTDFGFAVEHTASPLPKTELIKLYGKCGGVLHRGSLKTLLSQKAPIQIHYPDITAIAQKFVDLLSSHLVMMQGGEMIFLCTLRNINDNGKVQVAIAETKTLLEPPKPARGRDRAHEAG